MSKVIPDLPPDKAYHVFVCYNREDLNEVQVLVDALEQNGVTCCYYERDFKPGLKVLKNTHESMEKSLSILIVLSESSVNSKFCIHEIEEAVHMHVDNGYYLIPVKIEPCVVPECIRNVTYIDGSEDVITEVPRKVLRAITEKEIFAEHSRELNGECATFNVSSIKTGSRYTKWLSFSRYSLKISKFRRQNFIFGNNFQICADLLDEIEEIVNSSPAIKYRHIVANQKKIITFVLFLVLLTLFCVYNIVVLATMRSTMDYDRIFISLKVLLIGIPVLFGIWVVSMCINCCCCYNSIEKYLEAAQDYVTEVLWRRINKNHAKENKTIVHFSVSSTKIKLNILKCIATQTLTHKNKMKLKIMRYNFKTCQDYFSRRCERYDDLQRLRFHREEVEDYTDRIFDIYLSSHIGMLFESEPFALPHERRHTMANKAICLCKQVEDWLK